MSNINNIERKIKGLLAQSADREGSPEGDVFREKAFEMMARYGVEEAQLNTPEGNEMVSRTINLGGAYTVEQHGLYGAVGKALHCHVIGSGTARKIREITIYGRARHVERVVMLCSLLNPQMIVGANKAPGSIFGSTIVEKRSWMLGFTSRIFNRLSVAENNAFAEAGQGQELALVDDAKMAEQMGREDNPGTRSLTHRRQLDQRSMAAGHDAADNTDIGQSRMGNRAAITA